MSRVHSYVVRYDSGFAPNPFYGYCTLATCKPDIRRSAKENDWIVGTGSAAVEVGHGGRLVYAMRVTECLSFSQYDQDPRFEAKKPYRQGSRKQSCGDNIYFWDEVGEKWAQRDSFHSQADGSLHQEHVDIDTAVNRVLVSNDFVYFGGEGPEVPADMVDERGAWLCKSGMGRVCFDDEASVRRVEQWIRSFGVSGYQGAPYEWLSLRA